MHYVLLNHLLNSSNLPDTEESVNKNESDPKGQILYMIVIMLIFAIIVVMILVTKVKPRKINLSEMADREKAEYLLRNMQEHVVTENILEQLRDKEYRSKAWDIYRSNSKGRRNSRLDRALKTKEPDTIKKIDLKLENIQRSKKAIEEKSFDELNSSFRANFYSKEKVDKTKLDKNKVGFHKTSRKLFRPKNNNLTNFTPPRVVSDDKMNETFCSNDGCYYTFTGSSMEKAPLNSLKSLFESEAKLLCPKIHKLQSQHEKLDGYVSNHCLKGRFSVLPSIGEINSNIDSKNVSFNCRNNLIIKNDEPKF
ncbi:hypothetical protein BpHYR1_008530 [Brachionus plicatilis]|uniref:Uncharacterized protein n=1 Tax=Brachionus plicatilis TaxID=10195 RepID=A0A3M7T511_BRAPC|nr:hypothetical protein BpHYR1_008530 [Brachionus plicatilis]